MPDDRFIHPRLGHDERFQKLSWFERWVWATYVLAADDYGVMRFSAVTIRDTDAGMSREPESKIQRALGKMRDLRVLLVFCDGTRLYCCSKRWQDYQHIRHPRYTVHPAPPPEVIAECSDLTKILLAKHPRTSEILRENAGNIPAKFQQSSGDASEKLPPALAVSREPLAVSRVPCAGEHAGALRFPDNPTNAELRAFGTLVAPRDLRVHRHGPHDVTTKTHVALRQKAGVYLGSEDDAAIDSFLDAFYATTEAQWRAAREMPAGQSWKVWFAAYDAAYAATAPTAGTSKTAGNVGVVQRFIERGRTP